MSKLNKKTFRERSLLAEIKRDFSLNKAVYLMFVPVLVYYVLFHYLPMYGTIIAFKDFSPSIKVLSILSLRERNVSNTFCPNI